MTWMHFPNTAVRRPKMPSLGCGESSPARLALPAIVRSASVFPASGEVFPANSTALLVLDHRFHYQPPHELILPLPLPPACLAGAGASCCRGRVQCNGKMRNAATSSVKRGQNRFKSATSAQKPLHGVIYQLNQYLGGGRPEVLGGGTYALLPASYRYTQLDSSSVTVPGQKFCQPEPPLI
ncbi:hypothetical protein BRADI_4g25441v3 [Brachypodium distachyon]|uniref:Uncharacterized protein n=1 Tax=Brachypodium distachyon TaxID=15368 RepID=A0A2K2CQ71_BRADI|nr:hypothetical protein BRADI_4g25441v3 [Brachypodium distachyon]